MKKTVSIFLAFVTLAFTFMTACSSDEIKEISFVENSIVMEVGNTTQLITIVKPKKFKSESFTWSSSDQSVANVVDGNVEALAKGSTVITVLASNGVKASCRVTVKEVKITDITLDSTSITLKEGATQKLTADITPAKSTQKPKWTSSNPDVVYVDNEGKLIALKSGKSVITCSADDVSATCLVKVKSNKKSSSSSSSSASSSSVDEATQAPIHPKNYNVKAEVQQIRSWYSSTQANPGTKESYSGVDVYRRNGSVTKIFVKNGTDGWNYTREYYYNNDMLYFAFIHSGSEEHRLYFCDNTLIRYVDNYKRTTDYPNYIDCPFESQAVYEAYNLL